MCLCWLRRSPERQLHKVPMCKASLAFESGRATRSTIPRINIGTLFHLACVGELNGCMCSTCSNTVVLGSSDTKHSVQPTPPVPVPCGHPLCVSPLRWRQRWCIPRSVSTGIHQPSVGASRRNTWPLEYLRFTNI